MFKKPQLKKETAMKILPVLTASVAIWAFQSHAANVPYNIDSTHSSVAFSIRHMVVSTVRGSFEKISGTLSLDEKGTLVAAECTIPLESIHTRDAKRDEHLRSGDFFDAQNYPEITFKSTAIKKIAEGKYEVTGDLKMRDVSKSVLLPVDLNGPVQDPWGMTRVGFETAIKINRQDWNIKYEGLMGTGDKIVSDEVSIQVSVEGVLAK